MPTLSSKTITYEQLAKVIDHSLLHPELDMVLNIGQLRSGRHDFVRDDIQVVCEAAHARGVKQTV